MFDIFMEEKIVTVLMLACLVISLFLRAALGLLYHNMIRETDNMASTNNKMLKQCKLKFANCYQLSNGVSNIPIFVDKFLGRLSLGPLSYNMMYHLSGQAMLLSVVFSGAGICRCIIRGRTLGDILPFYIASFLGLYLYFSVSTVVDIRGKRRMLKVNLVDYLENHLSPRIDVTKQDMEMLYGEEAKNKVFGGKRRRGQKGEMPDAGRAAEGKKEKKTLELLPMGRKLSPEERRDLLAVANEFSDSRKLSESGCAGSPAAEMSPAEEASREEELETLLREFFA